MNVFSLRNFVILTSQKLKNHFFATLFASIAGGIFAFWLKHTQLKLLSSELPSLYPLHWWLHSICVGIILFQISVCLWGLIARFIFNVKHLSQYLTQTAFCHLALCLPLFGLAFSCSFLVYLVLCILLLGFHCRKNWHGIIKKNGQHFFVLFTIACSVALFNDFLTPFKWGTPFEVINKAESNYLWKAVATYDADFINAKAYDFSGLNPVALGGVPYSVMSGRSIPIQILALILNAPAIEKEAYIQISLFIVYTITVLGSFGFYLFLLYSANLSRLTCLLGGILYSLSNPFFSELLTYHFPFFSLPFSIFPYALLAIAFAFKKKILWLSFLASLVLSLGSTIWAPHPDSVIHAIVCFVLFSLYFASKPLKDLKRTLIYLTLSGVGFVFGVLVVYGPALEAILLGELRVLGHLNESYFIYGVKDGLLWNLKPLLRNYAGLLVILFFCIPQIQKSTTSKRPATFLAIFLILYLFTIVPGNDGPVAFFLNYFNLSTINFRMFSRVAMYSSLSVLCLILIGLDHFVDLPRKHWSKWVCYVLIITATIVNIKKLVDLPSLILASLFFLVLTSVFLVLFLPKEKDKLLKRVCVILCCLLAIVSESSVGLRGGEYDAASKCKTRIFLSPLLAMNRFIAYDEPRAQLLIKKRLLEASKLILETPSLSQSSNGKIFKEALAKRHITNAAGLTEEEIIPFAWETSKAIDALDAETRGCKNENYATAKELPVHIVNLETFARKLPTAFHRTLYAFSVGNVTTGMGLGVGLKISNMNQVFDLRMNYLYPPLNPLYLQPEFLFERLGEEFVPDENGVLNLLEPTKRKMHNIAGTEYFLILKEDLEEVKKLKEVKVLPEDFIDGINPLLALIQDSRAYGVAYLAKNIHYVSSSRNKLMTLRPPWVGANAKNLEAYKKEVGLLIDDLLKLDQKHSAIIETEESSLLGITEASPTSNTMDIENMIGSHAVFNVKCASSPCRLIFNNAAVSSWHAFSDATSVNIARANYAFMGVEVPQGDHLVWFENRPYSLAIATYLVLFSWLFVLWRLLFIKEKASNRISL